MTRPARCRWPLVLVTLVCFMAACHKWAPLEAPVEQALSEHHSEVRITLEGGQQVVLDSAWVGQNSAFGLAEGDTTSVPMAAVAEVEPGRHYQVRLPAKGQIRLASVVVPVGVVGENTTARWAVEGRIGDELLGSMVHEMNVPAIVPDLELPPVGSGQSASSAGDLAMVGALIAFLVAALVIRSDED